MNTPDIKRKLTAILSADVEGYSRLMGEDEVSTIRTLKNYKEIMAKLIHQYRGRVVDKNWRRIALAIPGILLIVVAAGKGFPIKIGPYWNTILMLCAGQG